MIKLVASDLDGTLLLNGSQEPSEELFPLIRRLREKGIYFVAATGRQYANVKKMFEPVLSDVIFICENGAMAVMDDKVLYQDLFEKELVLNILNTIHEKEDFEFTCSTKDYYYIRPKTDFYRHFITETKKFICKEIQSFDEVTEPCMKMAVYRKGGMSKEDIKFWVDSFKDHCTVVTSGMDWTDFIPFGTNKAKGLQTVCSILGVDMDACAVFGDEFNDIAMLESVPYSFAMAHAKEKVKEAANYQVERVEPLLEKLIQAEGNIEEVLKNVQ